jgi:hypothetical protein
VRVPSYLVETFLPRGASNDWESRARRARSAASELRRQGIGVRFDRTVHVPEDEMCFFIFEAASGREVSLAAERAGLDPLRVVEVTSSGEEQ